MNGQETRLDEALEQGCVPRLGHLLRTIPEQHLVQWQRAEDQPGYVAGQQDVQRARAQCTCKYHNCMHSQRLGQQPSGCMRNAATTCYGLATPRTACQRSGCNAKHPAKA